MGDTSRQEPGEMKFYNGVPSKAFMAVLIAVVVGFGLLLIVGGFRNGLGSMRADELGLLAIGAIVAMFGLLLARFVFWPRMTLGRQRLRVSHFFGTRSWRYDQIERLGILDQRIRPKVYTGGSAVHTSVHEFTIQHLVLKAKHKQTARFALPHSRDNGELLRRLSLATGFAVEQLDSGGGANEGRQSLPAVARYLVSTGHRVRSEPEHSGGNLRVLVAACAEQFDRSSLGDWDSCDKDLYAVRQLDADNPDVRNNLLCTLFYRLDREARESAPEAAS